METRVDERDRWRPRVGARARGDSSDCSATRRSRRPASNKICVGMDWRRRPMDETRYRLRDLADADSQSVARIWTRNDPESPISEHEVRQLFQRSDEPRFVHYRRAVEEVSSGDVVAIGFLRQDGITFDPAFARAGVSVDPAHQQQGIGRRLYTDLEAAAKARGLAGLWAGVRTLDPRGVRFFEQAGFREKRRQWVSRLDVNEAATEVRARSPDRWTSDGIVFTTVQEEGPERPQVRERLYRLYLDSIKDVPRLGGLTDSTLEEFVRMTFEDVGFLPEAIFLARAGDRYIAFSDLHRRVAEPDVLHISFTGTLAEFRGRGLAQELKRRSIEFARRHGYRYIETDNDSENEQIWSINRKLGFRQFRVWIMGEKLLTN
jgi:ribosomal protein S18 acetylase RimI-like enzyme